MEIHYSRLNVVWDMNVVPGFSLLGERVDEVLPSHQPKIYSSPHLEKSPPPPPTRLPPTKFLFPSYQKSIPRPTK